MIISLKTKEVITILINDKDYYKIAIDSKGLPLLYKMGTKEDK